MHGGVDLHGAANNNFSIDFVIPRAVEIFQLIKAMLLRCMYSHAEDDRAKPTVRECLPY